MDEDTYNIYRGLYGANDMWWAIFGVLVLFVGCVLYLRKGEK